MDESTCSAPQKIARGKVGPDGLTKHQRYYRKNAQRIKTNTVNRQKHVKESIARKVTKDVGVQTNKGSSGFGLGGRVFHWTYMEGGLNLWNRAINKRFQQAESSRCSIQLIQLRDDLKTRLTTGKDILEMLNGWRLSGTFDGNHGIHPGEAAREIGICIDMVSDVSRGIGLLEGWLTLLTTKLEPFEYDAVLEYDSDSEWKEED